MTNSELKIQPNAAEKPVGAQKGVASQNQHRTKKAARKGEPSNKTTKSSKSKVQRKRALVGGRAGTKSETILVLLRGSGGATLAQMMKATGWQSHSIRGFLATAAKRYNVKITSAKNGADPRVYKVVK